MLTFLGNILFRWHSLGKVPFCWPFLQNVRFCWLFWGNDRFRWPFLGIFWINSIDLMIIMPVPQSQSTQSLTLWKQIDSVTNQLTWKWDWIDSINFAEKMNWFKLVNSVELIGIQVCQPVDLTLARARCFFFITRTCTGGIRPPAPFETKGRRA